MGWCERFKREKLAGVILFTGRDWVIQSDSFRIKIEYCPFCGAVLKKEDY